MISLCVIFFPSRAITSCVGLLMVLKRPLQRSVSLSEKTKTTLKFRCQTIESIDNDDDPIRLQCISKKFFISAY